MVKTKEIIPYYKFKDEPSLYTNESLKKTLKLHYGKIGAGNKAVLFNKVKLCLETESLKNLAYTKQIIKLQSHTRKYNTIKQMKLCNLIPSVTKQLNNDSDFLICEHWKKNINYFFSYKDNDNFYYYFDIRSFDKLIKKGGTRAQNPYNRQKISLNIIRKVNKNACISIRFSAQQKEKLKKIQKILTHTDITITVRHLIRNSLKNKLWEE